MEQNNISVVINNYFVGGNNAPKGQKIYSVIVSHEAEVHENYLFTDKAKALAKMEEIRWSWENDKNDVDFEVFKYDENKLANFTPQFATKVGYWYQYGKWEYGSVEVVECVLG
jgi:hypothetical protein